MSLSPAHIPRLRAGGKFFFSVGKAADLSGRERERGGRGVIGPRVRLFFFVVFSCVLVPLGRILSSSAAAAAGRTLYKVWKGKSVSCSLVLFRRSETRRDQHLLDGMGRV